MASTLSPSAIHRIISLALPTGKEKNDGRYRRGCGLTRAPRYSHTLHQVNKTWKAVSELDITKEPAQPLDYLNSLELRLVLKDDVEGDDVRAIFAHGKPLEFWGCPRLLVSKIIEAFSELQKEPEFLDVTINALHGVGATRPSEAWPEVYAAHLPSHAFTSVETLEERRHLRNSSHLIPSSAGPAKTFAVENFHVSSEHFGKQLTVELHYELKQRPKGAEREQSSAFHKIIIRLADEICSTQGRLSGTANRSSATLLHLPEYACEVFGFLDRAHFGSSLLANRDLYDLFGQLKERLPVHHLRCAFEKVYSDSGCDSGAYWLVIRHFRRDLSYTDVRRFKMPSTAGADNDCALIRRYFSNSYVGDLQGPHADFRYTIKMLASLAACNVSIGRVELCSEAQRLSDYRSMDAIFGGMRMGTLHLWMAEHRFVELVKITDFFRMPMVQRLRELKLTLTPPRNEAEEPRGRASSKSLLWISGIYRLRNCHLYRVDYSNDRHLRSIERNVVQICEEFERGKITNTVEHFEFRPSSRTGMNYAFSRDNLLVSGMKVEGKKQWTRINNFAWDVYRFRNASTGRYLTACVGRSTSANGTECLLHIVKGEVYPDASFVGP